MKIYIEFGETGSNMQVKLLDENLNEINKTVEEDAVTKPHELFAAVLFTMIVKNAQGLRTKIFEAMDSVYSQVQANEKDI